MGRFINGDLLPITSGIGNLGVEGGTADGEFVLGDGLGIRPWGHIHQLSGVFHDPQHGTSGILRFNQEQGCLEVSNDGGLTFACIATAGGTVTSVGVLGDADLVGDVDFASPNSGFIVIEDTGNASPLLWSVDTLGLSGLFQFPANGFPSTLARCFSATFSAAVTWTVSHNIGTTDVIVEVYDASSPRQIITPDSIETTDANTTLISFNRSQAGRAVVIGCV